MHINILKGSCLKIGHDRLSLQNTISKLGHYARKGAKAAIKPLGLTIAGLALIAGTHSETNAQIRGDTLWATGAFVTINEETNNNVGNVSLYLTPETMAMVVPDTTYEFITDGEGVEFFDDPGLPVYIDSTTGIADLIKGESKVFPTVGSEMNAFFPQVQQGTIEVYNMAGQLVKTQEFDTDHQYLALDKLSTGMYVYNIQTADGVQLGGKFMKQNTPLKGPSARPSTTKTSTFKNTEMHEATYWAKWEHPDFLTDSTLITLEEGENDPIFFYLTPLPGIPQHQDIAGIVQNGDNNYTLMSGVDVRLINETIGDTLFLVTGSDGSFVFEDQPLDNDYLFSVGNVSGMSTFKNVPYTTPDEIEIEADTINDHFDAVLKTIPATTTPQHIKDQTSHGTRQVIVEYYLDDSFNNTQKNTLRNYFVTLEGDENSFDYEESLVPLNNTGITIEPGTYNTNPSSEGVTTPLGHTLYPVLYANTTLSPGNYVGFVHEIKQGIGLDQVAWPNAYSVMETPAQQYTQEDKDIGEFERAYWNSVYQDEKTWIDLNYISDSFQTNRSSSSSQNNVVYEYVSGDKK